jgi:hypothetical protein
MIGASLLHDAVCRVNEQGAQVWVAGYADEVDMNGRSSPLLLAVPVAVRPDRRLVAEDAGGGLRGTAAVMLFPLRLQPSSCIQRQNAVPRFSFSIESTSRHWLMSFA